jgi:undecaprenyl-diphosphatase
VIKYQLGLSIQWLVDREIDTCKLLNRISRRTAVKGFFVSVSKLGDGGAWYVLIVALPFIYGQSGVDTSFDMVKVGIANLVLYKVIKQVTGRPRPYATNLNITLEVAPLDQYSFPSGHTMHAVAFSFVAISHHPGMIWVLIPFSSSIAMSRIILGVHYPSDVIAGAMIGAYVASLSVAP